MTNSLLFTSLDIEISLTLALVCTFTDIPCLIPFLQSFLCVCSCFRSPDPTTYSFEQHYKFIFHEFTSIVELFPGKE